MKVEYLIDGYNLLMARSGSRLRPGPGNLERARSALLGWLANRIDPATVTVVFDASGSELPARDVPGHADSPIEVLFARDHENADALIDELCRHHSHPKQLVVVSDDHEVQRSARRCQARPMGCSEFEDLVNRPPPPPIPKKKIVPEKPAPSEAEREHWMRVFGDSGSPAGPPADPGSPTDPPGPRTDPPGPRTDPDRDFYRDMFEAEDPEDRSR